MAPGERAAVETATRGAGGLGGPDRRNRFRMKLLWHETARAATWDLPDSAPHRRHLRRIPVFELDFGA